MDFARYLCQNIEHHQLAAEPCPAHIGIGLPIAEEPSHTTVRTDRVYGGSADQEA